MVPETRVAVLGATPEGNSVGAQLHHAIWPYPQAGLGPHPVPPFTSDQGRPSSLCLGFLP